MNAIIETQRLLLRRLTPDDAEALHPVFADPEGTRFTLRVHSVVSETLDWINAVGKGYERHGLGPLAVVRKSDARVIGYCGCGYVRVDGERECEIGYRITRSCWGQGYATESVRGTVEHVLPEQAVPRIVALIQPDNVASVRVAEKAGMRLRGDTVYEDVPMRVYEIPAVCGQD